MPLTNLKIGEKDVKVDSSVASRIAEANADFHKATGQHLRIAQAFRTTEQQKELFEKSQRGEIGRAAPPGFSFHEKGTAIDVANWQEAEPYLRRYGLRNDLADDKNHFSYGETTKPKWINATEKIEKARKQGKSDTQITDSIFEKIPELADAIEEARARYGYDPKINNDRDLVNFLSLRYGGRMPTVASVPHKELEKMKGQTEQEDEGFFEMILGGAAEVAVIPIALTESIKALITESPQRAMEELRKPREVFGVGEVKPAFTGEETFSEATRKMIGYGAEIASFIPTGLGAKAVASTLKGAIAQGIKTAVPDFAIGGGLFEGGRSLRSGEPVPQVLKDAGYGAATAGVAGLFFGMAGPFVTRGIPKITKGILTKGSGLQEETIETALKRGKELREARQGAVTRKTIETRVKGAFEELGETISDTGSLYDGIRGLDSIINIPKGYWQEQLSDFGISLNKVGRINRKTSKKVMTKADKTAIDDFIKTFAKEGDVTADDFLRMRTGLTNVAKFDREKTSASILLSRQLRNRINRDFRPFIPGLNRIDDAYSPLKEFLKETKRVVDREGEVKLSTVVNSLRKGREKELAILEKMSPGIGDDLQLLKAIEDIEYASGQKVGTYANATLLGASALLFTGGHLGSLLGLIIAFPKVLIPILEQFSKIRGSSREFIQALIGKLRAGVKPNREEKEFIEVALQDVVQKADRKALPPAGGSSATGLDISPTPITPVPPTTFEAQAKIIGKTDTKVSDPRLKAALDKTQDEIIAYVEKFRKESGMMASNEKAGVRTRNITDARGNTEWVSNDFSLNRAKSDMKRRAEGMKKGAESLLYENDPEFRALVDSQDSMIERAIPELKDPLDADEIDRLLGGKIEDIKKDFPKNEYAQKNTPSDSSKTGSSSKNEETGTTKKEGVGDAKVDPADTSYKIAHRILDNESSPITLLNTDDLLKKVKELDGAYIPNHQLADLKKLKNIINNPNKPVKIYRASPINKLNVGDWVTISRDYAMNIKKQNGGKVFTYEVNASDLRYPNDISNTPSSARFAAFSYSPNKKTSK